LRLTMMKNFSTQDSKDQIANDIALRGCVNYTLWHGGDRMRCVGMRGQRAPRAGVRRTSSRAVVPRSTEGASGLSAGFLRRLCLSDL
jgi:hypothetical protein